MKKWHLNDFDVFFHLSLPRLLTDLLYIWITRQVSYKKHELLTLREHLSPPPVIFVGFMLLIVWIFCVFLNMCLYVLSSVLWCPLRLGIFKVCKCKLLTFPCHGIINICEIQNIIFTLVLLIQNVNTHYKIVFLPWTYTIKVFVNTWPKFFDGTFARIKLSRLHDQSMVKYWSDFIPSYLSVVNSKTSKMAELVLDSAKMSVKDFRKIGWVSISSMSINILWQSFWWRFTRSKNFIKENFHQVFYGKLLSCKRTFSNTNCIYYLCLALLMQIVNIIFARAILIQIVNIIFAQAILIQIIILHVSFCSVIWYCNILAYYLGNILAYYLDN
jgi:hypothetical protein